MFEYSVSKDMKKTMIIEEFQHVLKYLPTLIVKKLNLVLTLEKGRVVTIVKIIEH